METNQQVQNPQVEPAPITTPLQGVNPPQTNSGGNKKLILIIAVLLILTVSVGVLIYLRNSSLLKTSTSVQSVIDTFEDLKKDLEATDVGASEEDLSSFDKDLNSL